MFEKSLYDLIKGLRSHKGNESEYIQSVLKECRMEVRSQDMDVKATALLKLVYLEMFGHEMSWASFHVLEVMSSNKQLQKRVGYLGAAQTFRSHTEVLMLATNLLKKDLTSVAISTMSLPLITLPHVITSSLAISLLADILPRLSHSQPSIRKKTVVTLYRLALVYPETLRVAWPKIKERLLDLSEDSSVTAAVVNVVCELGWRRPQDFLPLAPRLFELLMHEGNNWMLIKIIKLFATLTPLEPRLVKKLLRPLTELIQTTEAMSLLYECINGIVQGGILNVTESAGEGEELANLCLSKLRGMIVAENDPNLKYVALLAFNKIVASHPLLVSAQQDVIMGCLDDPDVSIRLQALELVSGMVSPENLESIFNRLMKQLQSSPTNVAVPDEDEIVSTPIEPRADYDGEDPEEKLVEDQRTSEMPSLPNDYRHEVISRMLSMGAKDTYSLISDFEWYIDLLVKLVRLLPPNVLPGQNFNQLATQSANLPNLAERIGNQLRDLAVRVKEMRREACHAAESLVLISNRGNLFPTVAAGSDSVLEPSAWIAGEFASFLASPWETLNSLIHESCVELPDPVLNSYLQAIPKVFLRNVEIAREDWNLSRKTTTSLILARLISFLEKLAVHTDLDVQEKAVEYLELFRLAEEALSSQAPEDGPPTLLVSALPDLFGGTELNPVAAGAQRKVLPPDELDLAAPINSKLPFLLNVSQQDSAAGPDSDEFQAFYYEREEAPLVTKTNTHKAPDYRNVEQVSYQAAEDPHIEAIRRAARKERNRDDPFYIAPENGTSEGSSPRDIAHPNNGEGLDLDAIPIIDLRLDEGGTDSSGKRSLGSKSKKAKSRRRVQIASDETFDSDVPSSGNHSAPMSLETGHAFPTGRTRKPKGGILQVDSSGLHQLSLVEDASGSQLDFERREAEEAEMAAALKEVERMRLEMQRAADRIETAEGIDIEGTVVRKKKKKKKKAEDQAGEGRSDPIVDQQQDDEIVVKKKKKQKKPVAEVNTLLA